MREINKMRLHNINKWLEKPIVILITLLILFAYFAYGNLQFAKQNRELLLNTKQAVDNSNTIIKNLQGAVHDLKDDNERKTAIIICMLQVPIDQRTTDLESSCRSQAEAVMPTATISPTSASSTTSPSQVPSTTSPAETLPTSPITPTPEPQKPVRSLLCTITLNLLGCK